MNFIQRFKSLTKKAKNIVITTHLHPDADGIGSQLALCMALRSLKKNVLCVNEGILDARYHHLCPPNFLCSYEEFMQQHANQEIDLMIVVDTNSQERIGPNMQQLLSDSRHLLFVDHHPCQEELRALHCIDTTKAATGEIVGILIEALKIPFTPAMALPIYTAILVDTSSFRYPTVSGDTHRLIAKLMDTGGIQAQKAYNQVYGTKKISHMQLLGLILSNAQTTEDESIAWLTLSEDMMRRYKVGAEDTYTFINHLLVLDHIRIACMFQQKGDMVRVSLRSTGQVDVGALAQALGGGGHNHSAATLIKGPVDQVVKKTIAELKLMLKADQSKINH